MIQEVRVHGQADKWLSKITLNSQRVQGSEGQNVCGEGKHICCFMHNVHISRTYRVHSKNRGC